MSTECKDCKFREGDCGNHFISNGSTNYDIASLSACDKYGNCMFFERTDESKGDLISREALKENCVSCSSEWCSKERRYCKTCSGAIVTREMIDNAPTVNDCPNCEYKKNYDYICSSSSYKELQALREFKKENERPQGEWIRYRDNPHQPEHIKCSNCGQYWSIADHDKTFDFCFKCGAKMKGGVG